MAFSLIISILAKKAKELSLCNKLLQRYWDKNIWVCEKESISLKNIFFLHFIFFSLSCIWSLDLTGVGYMNWKRENKLDVQFSGDRSVQRTILYLSCPPPPRSLTQFYRKFKISFLFKLCINTVHICIFITKIISSNRNKKVG